MPALDVRHCLGIDVRMGMRLVFASYSLSNSSQFLFAKRFVQRTDVSCLELARIRVNQDAIALHFQFIFNK